MLTLVSLLKIIKKPNFRTVFMILGIILLFTGIFCFCKDDEFSGLISVTNELNEVNEKVQNPSSHHPTRKKKCKTLSANGKTDIFSYIFNRFYYVIVSTTTLGYGDIFPVSTKARCITIIYVLMIFFVSFLSA